MKNRIKNNVLGLIIGGQTLIFGLFLIWHDNFMETRGAYQTFTNVMDDGIAAIILTVIGFVNLLCILSGWNKLKRWTLVSTAFMWGLFWAAFLFREIAGYPNSGWIFTIGLLGAIIYEAAREDFK